jgi:hypothetical protein
MKYRNDLPEIPDRIKRLPVRRGYPVPWFVAEIHGEYDFRVADDLKLKQAIRQRLCWICGVRLGSMLCFPIGPMCAVNRINSEPPSHRECAEFAVKACPFLIQKEQQYRKENLPTDVPLMQSAGHMIERQPNVICLWLTKSYRLIPAPNGNNILFSLGDPEAVFWYSHGREASRDEVLESINSGLPILQELADQEGTRAVLDLGRKTGEALKLIPSESRPPRRNLFASAAK